MLDNIELMGDNLLIQIAWDSRATYWYSTVLYALPMTIAYDSSWKARGGLVKQLSLLLPSLHLTGWIVKTIL